MPIGLNEGNIGRNVCPGFGKSNFAAKKIAFCVPFFFRKCRNIVNNLINKLFLLFFSDGYKAFDLTTVQLFGEHHTPSRLI